MSVRKPDDELQVSPVAGCLFFGVALLLTVLGMRFGERSSQKNYPAVLRPL
jgi:hypothetical protein